MDTESISSHVSVNEATTNKQDIMEIYDEETHRKIENNLIFVIHAFSDFWLHSNVQKYADIRNIFSFSFFFFLILDLDCYIFTLEVFHNYL